MYKGLDLASAHNSDTSWNYAAAFTYHVDGARNWIADIHPRYLDIEPLTDESSRVLWASCPSKSVLYHMVQWEAHFHHPVQYEHLPRQVPELMARLDHPFVYDETRRYDSPARQLQRHRKTIILKGGRAIINKRTIETGTYVFEETAQRFLDRVAGQRVSRVISQEFTDLI